MKRLTALLLTATLLNACMSWHVEPPDPTHFSAAHPAPRARVTLTSGKRVTVHEAVIVGDSLLGTGEEYATTEGWMPGRHIAIPLGDVREITVGHGDPGKSLLLLMGIAAGTVLVLFVDCAAQGCFGGD